MYLAISYGFGIFTVLAVLALLWMGWEHKRDEVLAAKAKRAKEGSPLLHVGSLRSSLPAIR